MYRIIYTNNIVCVCLIHSNLFSKQKSTAADMVQAELMMEYQTVVLHAVRLNSGEREMILRQMALASYHYQLLTYKTP
jgi:short-subunit dehydrogenase